MIVVWQEAKLNFLLYNLKVQIGSVISRPLQDFAFLTVGFRSPYFYMFYHCFSFRVLCGLPNKAIYISRLWRHFSKNCLPIFLKLIIFISRHRTRTYKYVKFLPKWKHICIYWSIGSTVLLSLLLFSHSAKQSKTLDSTCKCNNIFLYNCEYKCYCYVFRTHSCTLLCLILSTLPV